MSVSCMLILRLGVQYERKLRAHTPTMNLSTSSGQAQYEDKLIQKKRK
ncbi:MAG TPA: hypothetical protein VHP36_04615 [Chitinispirillaceae bacterium]|nr:hypothetical protein [Chitinispirillaceae bacterium]